MDLKSSLSDAQGTKLLQQVSQACDLTYFAWSSSLKDQIPCSVLRTDPSTAPSVNQYQSLTHLHHNSPSRPKSTQTEHVCLWKVASPGKISSSHSSLSPVSPVKRTMRLWNQLSVEILGTLPCEPNAFRKSVRKVINVVNWRKCVLKVSKSVVKWSEVKWRVVQWRGGG